MKTKLQNQSQALLLDEVNLEEILHVIWVDKWKILCVTALALFLGILVALKQVPQYQANVLLQVNGHASGFGQAAGSIQQMILGDSSSGDSAIAQIALIKSRFILEPVVEKLGLKISSSYHSTKFIDHFLPPKVPLLAVEVLVAPHKLFNKKLRLVFLSEDKIVLYDQNKRILLQGKAGHLLHSTDNRIMLEIRKSKIPAGSEYDVVVRTGEKVVSTLMATLNVEEAGSRTHQSTGVLDMSLKGADSKQIVRTLNAIADVAREKDAEKKSQEAKQTLKFLYEQLPVTKKSLELAENDLNRYRAKSGKIDIKLQTQFSLNQLAGLAKEQSKLQVKKIEMLQRYTSVHPFMLSLEEQIKTLQLQEYELLMVLKKLPASDQVAVNLMRDAQVKKSLYMVLLQKIHELEVVKAGTVSGVRILSYAKIPDSPLPNKKFLICFVSFILGISIGIGYIFIRKMLSPRVVDPHWTERQFDVPNLAIVPYCEEQSIPEFGNKKLRLIAHEHSRNLAVESIRSLRTSVQVALACSNNNIISILGVCPGVGKSFISINLAYLLAAGGKRVLVVDGDLRRGTVHKYFGVAAKPGLAEFLNSQQPIEATWKKSSVHDNLYFLPRGEYPQDPSELLMSERLKHFVDMASAHFDVVIFDTAPVLLVTDGLLISRFSAINYLVLGAGVHRPNEVELAVKRLLSADIHLQGTIFNFHRAVAKNNNYYYGKYYYQNSYYYADKSIEQV